MTDDSLLHRHLRGSDRGLANGIMIFGVMLVTASILIIVMNPFMTPLEEAVLDQCAENPDGPRAACETGMGWVADFWTFFGFVAVFIAFIALVRQASIESQRPPGGAT